MLLRNTERFRELIELSINEGEARRFTLPGGAEVKTSGFFFEHEQSVFGLGVTNNCLWLVLQGKPVAYSEELVTEMDEAENERSFVVHQKGRRLFEVAYRPQKPHWNFFAMEDEDVDGFLLIHNVLSNPERKAVFLEANNG